MPLPTSKIGNLLQKTEGTSQTFGQLIVIPSTKDISSVTSQENKIVTNSPSDVVVKLITNEEGTFNELSDVERSKIAIAAFSENKEPTVAVSPALSINEVSFEGSSLGSFSTVKPNIPNFAIVVGSIFKPKEEIKKILDESGKVELMISLRSKDSENIEFNNLKELDLGADLTYNFFIAEEADIVSQEDPSQDPLLKNSTFNVPRFIELKWTPVKVTEILTDQEIQGNKKEIQKLKKEVFSVKKGVSSIESAFFKNSFEKSKKKLNLIDKEGTKKEIVDMHKLDLAFESTSNKKVFTNTIHTVFNKKDQPNEVSSIPILSLG